METKLAFPYFLGRVVAIGLDIEIKIASAGRIVRPPPEDAGPGGLAKSATDLFADDVSLWVGELHGPEYIKPWMRLAARGHCLGDER